MRALGLLVGLVGLAMVVTACSSSGGDKKDTGGTAPSAAAVTVVGSEFKFEPATINAKVGQEVTVTFNNKGTTAHDFTSTDLNVKTALVEAGKTATVKITPSKAGTFKFFCSVAGHEAGGMKGEIKVS